MSLGVASSTLSVIVRTIGDADHLHDAVDSLAAQSRREFEVVIVDMSGGPAHAVIEQLRSRLPKVTHLDTRGRKLSRPAALNAGIARAEGLYIGILDEDNCWEPAHVGAVVDALAESGADVAYTGVRRIGLTAGGTVLGEDWTYEPFDADKLLRGNYIYSSATVFRRSLWREVGGYDERFPVYEDWEFLIRATRGRKVTPIPVTTAVSRNFTGAFLVPRHSMAEPDDCARCLAAVFWKHRAIAPGLLRERFTPKESSRLLASWWWRAHVSRLRPVRYDIS
jgi:hypothetical protein